MDEVEDQLKALMLAGLDGDAGAQRRLLSLLADLLRSFFARRLGRDDADVEDLVQDALIAMHERRASFDRAQRFTPWAYAIARYKLIDHYRRKRVRAAVPLEDAGALIAFETADGTMAAHDVDRLLEGLSDKQRAAIEQTRLRGLSIEEAAETTGMSASAVKVNVHRGLKTLMGRVRKGGEGED